MVHAELEHAVGGALRQPGEAERCTDVVVEIAGARERGTAACERAGEQLLGPGLADAADE